MLIVEHFLLIGLDPQQGLLRLPRRGSSANSLAAAALLLDLTDQRRLRLSEAGLQVESSIPLTHPLLTDCLHALGHQTWTARRAMEHLERRLEPLSGRVLEGLCRRDLLHRVERRRGLFARRIHYPLRSMQAHNEAMALLTEAALAQHPTVHGLSLLLLCDIAGLLPTLLAADAHERGERQLLTLNAVTAHTDDATRIVAAVRQAILE